MIIQQTIDKLNWMKLCKMAEEYRRQADMPEVIDIPFDDRFGILADAEWSARQNKRIANLVKKAGMKYNAAIEEVDYSPRRKLNKQLILRLSTCTWINEGLNVIITGATGAGKTFLGCALGNCACRNNYKVIYKRVPRLLTDIAISKGDGTYSQLMKDLKKVNLLILDDWGLNPLGAIEGRDILEVIEERTQNNSTLLISQIPKEAWHGLFSDPTVADAVLDRILHGSYKIEIDGDTMRIMWNKNLNKAE